MGDCQIAHEQPSKAAIDFPLFCKLPPEVRLLIWEQALGENTEDPPALFAYRRGCWQPRYLLPSDPEYLHDWGPDNNIDFSFHHYLLEPVELQISPYFVNREARSVALRWMHHHFIETWSYHGRVVFSRWFDKDRDILYIPGGSDEFLHEVANRPFEPDLLGKTISSGYDNFTKLAMPASVLQSDPSIIVYAFPDYAADKIFLVVGDEPRWESGSPVEGKVSHRFEIDEDPPGKALIWDVQKEILQLGSGSDDIAKDLRKFLKSHGEALREVLIENGVQVFKIQPTYLKKTLRQPKSYL